MELINYTTSECRYYLYRHIRLDKNEPFYIGIGTKQKGASESENYIYKRACIKANRNIIWKRIVQKTDYKIQIIYESDTYKDVLIKEMEFVILYGRINLETGTLSNLTDGGEGNYNVVYTKERIEKISNSRIKRGEPIFQYSANGDLIKKWDAKGMAVKELNIILTKRRLDSHRKTLNFYWTTNPQTKDFFEKYKTFYPHDVNKKVVYQYDFNGNLIEVWNSISSVKRKHHVDFSHNNKINILHEYAWSCTEITKNDIDDKLNHLKLRKIEGAKKRVETILLKNKTI